MMLVISGSQVKIIECKEMYMVSIIIIKEVFVVPVN